MTAVLPVGTRITGKWSGIECVIERCLGAGTNGEVYLVRTRLGRAAMKVCRRPADAALEWGLLERLGANCGALPKAMVIDDAPPDLYFYVMEWVPGVPFNEALRAGRAGDARAVVAAACHGLRDLHQAGHAFCDIKPENILVATGDAPAVRFVDAGGLTEFGRSVRQYTPYCDRAFWGLGSRTAEPAYDIAGLALAILTSSARPPDTLFARSPETRQAWLWKAASRFPDASSAAVLIAALRGRFQHVDDFLAAWTRVPAASAGKGLTSRRGAAGRGGVRPRPGQARTQPSRRSTADWTEWVMWLSLGTAAAITIAAWGTFLGWL